ncbi:MAG TPA: nucleotide sugar dehydrogenase [Anaeromyxobacter sp.]|nr:nucleotide sugar dehydrogenase [Anaeromyxobacter sp.]
MPEPSVARKRFALTLANAVVYARRVRPAPMKHEDAAAAEPVTGRRIAVLGGCGRVGLPLALAFAAQGSDVTVVDVDAAAVARTNRGEMGFRDAGADELLRAHAGVNLRATTAPEALAAADTVICVVGRASAGSDEGDAFLALVEALAPHLRAGQLLVLRSTVPPGTTERLARWLDARLPGMDLACCPERAVEGHALEELARLPQLVAGATPRAGARARALFARIAPEVVELAPLEAEVGKLLCNAWRAVTFAVANEFHALCAARGLDYARLHGAVTRDYPRAQGLPRAGLAGGPCLSRDVERLAAFADGDFSLGRAAAAVHRAFPLVLLGQLRPLGLGGKVVGLLGMAFKAESDDGRDSLAFELARLLAPECRAVLCTDEHLRAPGLVPLERVLAEADALVVTAPHARYRSLCPRQPVLDPWNALGRGSLLR